ncbi:hypothetical protein GVX76_06385, partial [[Haemophilus] felis]|nr:hypothetical protein [[Haemophilus] felis]
FTKQKELIKRLDSLKQEINRLKSNYSLEKEQLLREIEWKEIQIEDYEKIRKEKDEYINRLNIKITQMAAENVKRSKFQQKGKKKWKR